MVVMVMIDEPRGQVYGGLVAAPVFSRISTQALQYLKVAPTQPLSPGETLPTVEEILAQAKKEQDAAAKDAKKAAEVEAASAPVERTEPAEATDAVVADGGAPAIPAGPRMPDFKGMSYRQVIEMMQARGINVSLRGHGQVIEQSPAPGAAIPYGAQVWVRLAPPGQLETASVSGPKG
jgi:cell division protein FtsI (penicillin-binding protein 3)